MTKVFVEQSLALPGSESKRIKQNLFMVMVILSALVKRFNVSRMQASHWPCDHMIIWVKMPRKNNGQINVLSLLFLAAYCGQL